MTRVGIQISSVRKYLQTPADVLASFQKVSAAGYRIIQVQWIAPQVPIEFIHEALQETKLVCVGTQDYYDDVIGRWDAFLAMNALWGGRNVCVSGIPERYRSYEGCLALARDLNQRSVDLERQGMLVSFHPRASDVLQFEGKNSLELILENTRPECQFVLDVYHLVKAGFDPVQWIHKVEGRNDLIHFKDRKIMPDGSEVLVPVGQGDIDWAPVFQACAATHIQYGFAEQESWLKDPFECLQESYDYIVSNGIEA
jgi:sugar phosphate isomerase/epimerase